MTNPGTDASIAAAAKAQGLDAALALFPQDVAAAIARARDQAAALAATPVSRKQAP